MDIISIIDRLESLMYTSKAVPVSGNIIVEKHKALELIDQLRLSVPQEIRAAEEVLGGKDEIVKQAVVEARRTRVQADDEYRSRMNEHEMALNAQSKADATLREAEQRAAKLLKQSEENARTRRAEADAYALRSLRSLEQEVNVIAGSVRKGIDYLAGQSDGNMLSPEVALAND